ncbi:MAG: sugar phosphate isomerase/epimerase [Caldilineaceae bacterium]
MNIHNFGLSVSVENGFRKLAQLEATLDHVAAQGFDMVELDMQPFILIINGELQQRHVSDLAAVLKNFKLRYSVHGVSRLNLAYDPRHELCLAIMRAQIEACRQIGARALVYHSGLQALDRVRHGLRETLLSNAELSEGAQREVVAFRSVAPLAADAGLIIGIENGDSHQWEHQVIARFGLPRQELLRHHARLQMQPIVQQLEAINHPNIGMTFDLGHLHIAANDLGFDYLQNVEIAAPWVKHLHISDNCGTLDAGFNNPPDRWSFGEADLHMPPGWAKVPYRDVFARMSNYQGDLILEIDTGFLDYTQEALETIKMLTR